MVTDSNSESRSLFAKPWMQLILGIICMIVVANLQYGWTYCSSIRSMPSTTGGWPPSRSRSPSSC